jgi:hypothetical protein
VKSLTKNLAPPKKLRTLKRKVGYTNEEVYKTCAKLDQMAIDEPTENADELGKKECKLKETNLG